MQIEGSCHCGQVRFRWVPVPNGRQDVHRDGYPDESLEEWHRRHGLLD